MKYDDGFQLNVDNMALKCPSCGNSGINEEDRHCSICGFLLYNECLNEHNYGYSCYHRNRGNARYCVKCGSETYFSREGLLANWSDARELNIKRLELEFKITKGSTITSFLFDWDFVLFTLEGDELLSAALEKSKAKIVSNKLLVYLYNKEQKEILSDAILSSILFDKIEQIYKTENLDLQFKEIYLIAPGDSIEDIYVADGIPF